MLEIVEGKRLNARVRLGLWVLNGALYVLGAGQHGLGERDKRWD